ncbi:hypothetical protein [Actinotalea subterranea]|nr:hypothetical protein [Actinotalea subterranea]
MMFWGPGLDAEISYRQERVAEVFDARPRAGRTHGTWWPRRGER